MKVLVRLPNWLGDMVMSVGFIHQLHWFFPGAEVSVIAKKGIQELLPFFPAIEHQFIFDKETSASLHSVWKFGKEIKATAAFDIFFSLPDSFSSALMGFATGATQRVGYKKEGRQLLLTDAYAKELDTHRVEEYVNLLEQLKQKKATNISVCLQHSFQKSDHLVININSEASSRRLTLSKAVEIITAVRKSFTGKIILIGAQKEKNFVETVVAMLPSKEKIESVAGKTSLADLCEILATAQLVLTTDSGPAHLANALGTQTLVLFGAGNENNTAPYQKNLLQTMRLGKLSCEPCTKNICMQFSTPQCLELLETETILQLINNKLLQWQ